MASTTSGAFSPFFHKTLVAKKAHVFPLLGLVDGALGIGGYYVIQHVRNSPNIVMNPSQRSAYTFADLEDVGYVKKDEPTFYVLRKLKGRPILAFNGDMSKAIHYDGESHVQYEKE